MKLSICIVNWEGEEIFYKCIKSIEENCKDIKNYEIVIIDNNSKLTNFKKIKKYKNIKIFKNKKNLFFSLATNQSIKKSSGDLLLILNNDIILKKECIKNLYQKINSLNCDAVVPKLLYPNKQIQNSISGIPKIKDIFFTSTGLNLISKKLNNWILNDFNYKKEQEIKLQPAFSALMVKKSSWVKVGGLDKKLPLLWNDVDWFFRFYQKKQKCFYIPSAECIHYHGYSVNKNRLKKIIISTKGMYYFFKKSYKQNNLQKIVLLTLCLYTFLVRYIRELLIIKLKILNKPGK